MKKTVLLFFAIVLCLLVLCGCERERGEENPASDFEYVENEDGGITITKYIGESKDVVIPKKIDGKKVTEIGENAFYAENWLLSVDIPDSVKFIDNHAFSKCTEMKTIILPKSLEIIDNFAFFECISLCEITLPGSLKEIREGAFMLCESLKHITIPKSITFWGESTFAGSGVESVTFEKGLRTIGDSAFSSSKLKTVTLPDSIHTIEPYAFTNCSELESVVLNDGLVTIQYCAFLSNTKLTEIIIPKSVEQVYESSFEGCSELKKIKFEGYAPKDFILDYNYDFEKLNFTVYYHEGAEGFTSPEWNGYPTKIW